MPKNSNPQHPCLTPEKLRWRCDPATIPYETTAEVEPVTGDIGQARALRALRMGVELTASGYNLFVCGLSGSSRGGMIVRMIEEMHPQTEPAPDRCYVNNFKNADRPRLLQILLWSEDLQRLLRRPGNQPTASTPQLNSVCC